MEEREQPWDPAPELMYPSVTIIGTQLQQILILSFQILGSWARRFESLNSHGQISISVLGDSSDWGQSYVM